MMAALSHRYCGLPPGPFLSIAAGIFELGLTETKPVVNCSSFAMLTVCASYSSPSSSRRMLTFAPFGVASEYSWSGAGPSGSALTER